MSEGMRLALSAIGGLAVFLGAGWGLTELFPALRRRTPVVRCAYAYLMGVAWVGGMAFAGSHFLHLELRRGFFLALAIAPLAAGVVRLALPHDAASRGPFRTSAAPESHWVKVLVASAAAAGAAVSLGLISEAMTNPVRDWDGRMTWSAQARYIRAERSVDARALREGRWSMSHPAYPPLLPLSQVAVLEIFDRSDDERSVRPLYAAFFPVFLVILFDEAARRAGRAAAAVTVLVGASVPFLASGLGAASSCYSNFPLACFYGAGALLLVQADEGNGTALAAGVLLAGAVLSKAEGTPLALAALGVAALRPLRTAVTRRRLAALFPALLPIAFALLVFLSWKRGIPPRDEEQYVGFLRLGRTYAELPGRILRSIPVAVDQMLSGADWNGFFIVLPVVLVCGAGALRRNVSLVLLSAAPLALAFAGYGVGAGSLPGELARATWDRFLLQAMLPLLTLFAAALSAIFRGAVESGGSPPEHRLLAQAPRTC